MDPLEVNTSANIRNRGLLQGLVKLGFSVDTCSLAKDAGSVSFDASVEDIDAYTEQRYYFEPTTLYKYLRTRAVPAKVPEKAAGAESEQTAESAMPEGFTGKVKKIIKAVTRKVLSNNLYEPQAVNLKNVAKVGIDISQYDAIISSSDPKATHLIAERLLKKSRSSKPRWIQYWGDPMYGDITGSGNAKREQRLKAEERRLLSQADGVVYTSPFTLEQEKAHHPEFAGRMTYSVQAVAGSVSDGSNAGIDRETAGTKKYELGYFGNFPERVRNIQPLLQACDQKERFLLVCGDGDQRLDSRFITYHPRVGARELEALEASVSITVCLCNSRGAQIPGKIYYEAASQKPIIVIVDGENAEGMKRFFAGFDRYILCDNTVESILNGISQAEREIVGGKTYEVPEAMLPETVARKVLAVVGLEAGQK